ncbi:D-methionine transport system substrate-binding protein [Bradyrhizobium sp. USDA 4524]|uniref:MetQ/NlpA family ABC transporter substrate-binding protein n=1 Tax=unclassified Bradyrhizobium TaxID=2631580 RepID=UPI00209CD049|nr:MULTISPECIES: MetQ/NlpA family ABC transporter substrate-binding protein [unclassified Bradyrhizobium]MCP1845565.1 D-methionine transport system substrate-binding protein [Bradyrhizobium sp. USDA 4538]MCP1907113.1 D-methionine transport system substrate-binding protein [Bradyrhizobium sp. USDA 4537]MCP1985588.1 D-methionine transport system substrate-binding protein [Bradyrhizobium sp. USDA 4539]
MKGGIEIGGYHRRFLLAMVAAGAVFAVGFARPGEAAERLKVGTSGGPVADILQFAAARAREQGLDVKVIEFSDWVTPNEALQSGDIDANLFQHTPFLNNAIAARGYTFTPIAPTYVLPVGLYSKKIAKISEVHSGTRAAVVNDPVNEARGLLLFEKAGLIKLREGAGDKASVRDIVENPKNLKFLEIEAPQLPRILDDVELAQVSINYLIASGGDPESLLIADGFGDPRYALQFVARTDRKDDPRLSRFVAIYRSPEVKDYITKKYGRFIVPVW